MSDKAHVSVLFFNLHDPSGRACLPAAAINATELQCQPFSVITALSAQDSSHLEDIFPVSDEIIEEQARCLLEDMTVQAIHVSHLYSHEAMVTCAQIVADYQHAPMVLSLGQQNFSLVSDDHDTIDSLVSTYLSVLAPHAHTVVIDMTYADQWLTEDELDSDYESLINQVFELGAEHCVLLSNTRDRQNVLNTLYYPSGDIEHFTYEQPALHQAEFSDIFSSSLSCFLAHKLEPKEAVQQALIYTLRQFAQLVSLGMGRPQPNRLASP